MTSTALFHVLSGFAPPETLAHTGDHVALAAWLRARELGPLAYARLGSAWPALAQLLQDDALAALAENSLQYEMLGRAAAALDAAGIPLVVLKGAAAADGYGGSDWRTMSDVDVWVPDSQGAPAVAALRAAGFNAVSIAPGLADPQRPELSLHGKRSFNLPDWRSGQIELHTRPFSGAWLDRFARLDEDDFWSRRVPLNARAIPACRPAATDLALHAAVHVAINHQYDATAHRSLLDIALLAAASQIEWPALTERAAAGRVRLPVWLALDLLDGLLNVPQFKAPVRALRPGPVRRRLLRAYINAPALLGHAPSIFTRFSTGTAPRRLLRLPFLALMIEQ